MRVTTVTIQYNDIPRSRWSVAAAKGVTPNSSDSTDPLTPGLLVHALFLLPHRHDAEQNRPAFKQGQAPRFSTRLQILPHVQLPAPGSRENWSPSSKRRRLELPLKLAILGVDTCLPVFTNAPHGV